MFPNHLPIVSKAFFEELNRRVTSLKDEPIFYCRLARPGDDAIHYYDIREVGRPTFSGRSEAEIVSKMLSYLLARDCTILEELWWRLIAKATELIHYSELWSYNYNVAEYLNTEARVTAFVNKHIDKITDSFIWHLFGKGYLRVTEIY